MAAVDEWNVRASIGADAAVRQRWLRGYGKVGARLETRSSVVMVSLTSDGVLTLRLSPPGDGSGGSLMVMGRLARDGSGRLTFRPSHPKLGFGVEVRR